MSYLYSLVARLFTSEQKDETESIISHEHLNSSTEPVNSETVSETITRIETASDQTKIVELNRLVARLENRLLEAHNMNEKLQEYADNLIKEKIAIETKYVKECERTRVLRDRFLILRDRFLKEPDVTTLFAGLDNMTINQFKNVIPKMDLSEFSELTSKDKYFNACMFMLVRKFNANNPHNTNEFIDYVLNNDSLTVSVREYLNSNENIATVKRELCDFYDFAKMFAD
jgi:hypothetical protein